jgi:hypothetical protein
MHPPADQVTRLTPAFRPARSQLLNELMVKNAAKMPWKVIEHMPVESVTFGLVPPQVQFCFAKYDPKAQLLKLSMDFKFNSSGFQVGGGLVVVVLGGGGGGGRSGSGRVWAQGTRQATWIDDPPCLSNSPIGHVPAS